MPLDDFGWYFWVIIVLAVVSTIVGLRTTWLSGTFMSRSRVNYSNTGAPGKTVEQRLTELSGLKDKGVIDDAEYQRARTQILSDIANN